MPQCPICNAAVWVGQQYCTTCTNPIPQKEGESQPEIAWSLSATPARVLRFPLRGQDICLVTGVLIIALVLFLLYHKSPITPLLMTPPPQAAFEQVSPPSPITPAATAPPAPQVKVQETAAIRTPAVSSSPEVQTPAPTPATSAATSPLPVYFVNTIELSVRESPHTSTPRIATLNFEDEVELLETSGGWGRVWHAERDVVGWSYMRYLQPLAAEDSGAISQHRPAVPKGPEPVSSQVPKHM